MTEASALSPHLALRAATADKHEQVDAIFAGHDLADRASYTAFLLAHARVLPPVERLLADRPRFLDFPPRTPAIAADLAALGRQLPSPEPVPAPRSDAAAWGMLYVIEGSRLGGAFLARSVPDGLPKAYLSAAHARGGWRALLAALDAELAAAGESGVAEAVDAARATFDLYAAAAHDVDPSRGGPVSES